MRESPAVEKGLVIREPWIDLILSGEKTWEMRSRHTSYRRWLALVRKGSGLVSGVCRIESVGAALTSSQMVASYDHHRIPEAMILSGEVAKWTTPWKLADIQVLAKPVPYHHPNGAIGIFDLDPEARAAIAAQINGGIVTPQVASSPSSLSEPAPEAESARHQPDITGFFVGATELTAGNLKHHHFYLRRFLNHFPEQLIGGRDRDAPFLAILEAPGCEPTRTDICPRHGFFRDRVWTRRFLANCDAAPGDIVHVYRIGAGHYRAELRKEGQI